MRPKIYLFGDSITEESFAMAVGVLSRSSILSHGYSGYNTRWALKVVERVFPAELDCGVGRSPATVTVFFGANDACLPDRCSGFQHVPVDEYKQNLSSIVSFLREQWPEAIVVLISPPPIDENARLLHPFSENALGLPERTNQAAGAYAKACVAVAGECGIPAVDLWTKMQQFPDWQKAYLRDGLHLSEGGNRIVFEEVIKKLREAGLSLETLPVDLPLIVEIDPNDPLKTFQK
ncbi:SGNH hydrolase-type esterase superfamily protein [Actinidia rufa]|uniref:SGNH hydrolase-type esterase superfamily protein n=1 Tax=Actinidia rufa TaxID=165716 RepID=A0A7J0EZQ9_9ERIC|nr:SGNH hydrolase-type esterase superfamily protein [Actinidia rufa]